MQIQRRIQMSGSYVDPEKGIGTQTLGEKKNSTNTYVNRREGGSEGISHLHQNHS